MQFCILAYLSNRSLGWCYSVQGLALFSWTLFYQTGAFSHARIPWRYFRAGSWTVQLSPKDHISYHSLVLPARLLKMEKSKVAKKELTHTPCFYSILCSAILLVFALQHYKHSRLLFSLPILNTGINDYPAILWHLHGNISCPSPEQ